MSGEKTAERPRLAGMKFLVEEILSPDDDGKVMKISDQGELGKLYALKVSTAKDPQDDAKLARCRAAAEASEKLGHPADLEVSRLPRPEIVVPRRPRRIADGVRRRQEPE